MTAAFLVGGTELLRGRPDRAARWEQRIVERAEIRSHPLSKAMGLIFGWGFDYQAKWRTGVLLRRYMPTADLSAEDIERWSWFERQLTSPDVVRTYMNRVLDTDVRAALPLIQAPTLVVHRTDNKTVPVDYGRDLGARIPGAKYVELPGDEHMRGLACRRPRSPGGSEKQWSSRSTRRE